jgi:predicted RNA-binding Zn-ribbon protein involved in translation (DUF1610 family)
MMAMLYRNDRAAATSAALWQHQRMSKPKVRPRTARREAQRQADVIERTRDRIVRLQPGGSADWPITVESAVLVERRAAEFKCTQCGDELDIKSHDAKVVGTSRRRIVGASCRSCGHVRTLWFTIVEPVEN